MKTLFLIGGPMGVGKTTIGQVLNNRLNKAVFLDGDWCWYANPFVVNDNTKGMVLENISFLLNQYIKCSEYDNIILSWVMHEQQIIDYIVDRIDNKNVKIISVSLVCDPEILKKRIINDSKNQSRNIDDSIARLSLYEKLNTVKIDTSNKSITEIIDEILLLKDFDISKSGVLL